MTNVREDADSMAALTRLVGDFTGRANLDLKFRTGRQELYSDEEKRGSIELPALFFANLDEQNAKEIAGALTDAGVRAIATPRRLEHRVMRPRTSSSSAVSRSESHVVMVPVRLARASSGTPIGAQPLAVRALPILMLGVPLAIWGSKLFGLLPLFRLRAPVLAGGPAASRLLAEGTRVSAEIAAPEARALFAEAHRALYRLTRRAEELARPDAPRSSEEALARRLVEAAPAINARLETSARQLAALDAALDGESEGETVRALSALARRATTAPPTSGPRSTTPAAPWRRPSSGARSLKQSASISPPRSAARSPPCATSGTAPPPSRPPASASWRRSRRRSELGELASRLLSMICSAV